MAKKQQSALGLATLTGRPGLSTNGNLAIPGSRFGLDKGHTKEEEWTIKEWRKETLVMDAVRSKTIFGLSLIGEIHQHGAITFDETVDCILDIKNQVRDSEHQLYVNEFSHRQIQLAAHHLLGAIEAGAYNIGVEINRSLYPPDFPEREGLLQRLFGR